MHPVLGHVRDPGADRSARVTRLQRRTGNSDSACRQLAHPGHGLRQLTLTVPRNARDPEHLARTDGERNGLEGVSPTITGGGDALDVQHDVADRCLALPPSGDIDVAPDHERRERLRRRACRVDRGDRTAAAEHGDAIRDLEHLVQLVGDHDHRMPLGSHDANRAEQLARLLRRQHRGRLVEDQHLRAAPYAPS